MKGNFVMTRSAVANNSKTKTESKGKEKRKEEEKKEEHGIFPSICSTIKKVKSPIVLEIVPRKENASFTHSQDCYIMQPKRRALRERRKSGREKEWKSALVISQASK